MVRAPTRLEIITKIEEYINEIMKKISMSEIQYFSNLLKYLEDTKNIIVKELEHKRKRKISEEERKERQIEQIATLITNMCFDETLSRERLKSEIQKILSEIV